MWPEKLKNWLFSTFFHLFGVQWTCTPLEMIQCIQIPFLGHKLHHYWSSGTNSSSGNGHILLWKLPEKWEYLIFQLSSIILYPTDLWKWLSASKYPTGATSSTFFSHLEQFITLKMAIYKRENGGKTLFFHHWLLVFDCMELLYYLSYLKVKGTCGKLIYRPLIWYLAVHPRVRTLKTKSWKKVEKIRNSHFSGSFQSRI